MAYNRRGTLNCETNTDAECAVEAALSIIGGKWKIKIYKALRGGSPMRYSVLAKTLPGISEKMLSAQLREMEEDEMVMRLVYPEVPPRVEYQLTALGHSLQGVFLALTNWGKEYIQNKASSKSIEPQIHLHF